MLSNLKLNYTLNKNSDFNLFQTSTLNAFITATSNQCTTFSVYITNINEPDFDIQVRISQTSTRQKPHLEEERHQSTKKWITCKHLLGQSNPSFI